MSTKAVLTRDGVFKNEILQWFKGECHISTEENESAKCRKILKDGPNWRKVNNGVKSELAQQNSGVKSEDIDYQNGLMGEMLV